MHQKLILSAVNFITDFGPWIRQICFLFLHRTEKQRRSEGYWRPVWSFSLGDPPPSPFTMQLLKSALFIEFLPSSLFVLESTLTMTSEIKRIKKKFLQTVLSSRHPTFLVDISLVQLGSTKKSQLLPHPTSKKIEKAMNYP